MNQQSTVNGVPTGEIIEGPITVRFGESVLGSEPYDTMRDAYRRFKQLINERNFENVYVFIGDQIVHSWSKSYDDYLAWADEQDEDDNGYS